MQGKSAAVGSADDPAGWERHAQSFVLGGDESLDGAKSMG